MSTHLEELNPSQLEAATHETGPLLIIAGPGSGKTQTVAHSIAYAIEVLKEVPNRIAAFTFTRKAKDELKNRVSEIIGNDLANDIRISTFHSFCGSVVKEDFDPFRIEVNREFTVKELMRLNEERIRAEIDRIQHHIFPESDDVLRFITRCQERNINSSDAREYVPDPQIADMYVDTLKKYEQLADDDSPYTRVQLLTYVLFRDVSEVKAKWQEKFNLIFVDEYQDTDQVQYQIIQYLAERHQNLRVVGDDDQGIYGWRGANIQNILNFEKDFSNPKVISLGQNYRSTRQIVNTSRAIIDFNPDRREKKLFTNNPEGDKVKHLHCEDREAEASTIAGFISRAIQSGWTADDFVVLCPSTKNQAAPFKEAFANSGIPFHVVEGSSDMPTNGVSIMTIHKSKGLEFPNVFVAGVCSGLLENWDEALRLLYVAMTRAENWLCLSSYEKDSSDKNTSFKRGPSWFLDFIPQSLVARIKTLDNIAIPSRVKKVEDAEKSQKDATSLPMRHQTVLGIDPGKENVGWSITKRLSDRYTCKYGTARPAGQPIDRKINELIMKYSPDAISVERLEGATDKWFLHVAGCVAQIKSIADQRDIECQSYSPQDVKYAVTGNKNASKEEVQQAVRQVCNLKEIPEPDHSADAIATSLCYLRNYLNYSRFQNNARMKEHYDTGSAYLGLRQCNEAIVEFDKAINNAPMIGPMYTKGHCGLARAYLGLGKLEEAENSAKEALRLDANYQLAHALLADIKQAHVNRGKNYLKQDELVAAERSAREACRLDPNCQETNALLEAIKQAYCNRGCNRLENRRYDEAITAFRETINKYPSFTEAYCGLARAYLGQDKLIEAEKAVIEALRLQDDNQSALQVLEDIKQKDYERGMSYLQQGDLVSAEKPAREALRLGHQLAHDLLEAIKQTYYNRGCDHLDNRRYDEAITAFRETINKYPSFTETYCGLGWAYLGKGNLAMAGRSVRSAYELDPNSRPVLQLMEAIKGRHCELGRDYLNQGNLSAAEESVNEALRLDPNDPHYQPAQNLLDAIKQTYYNRGSNYLKQGDWDAAADSARNALRLDENYLPARELRETIRKLYYDQGLDYIADSAFDGAVKSLQKAKDIDPNDKAVWTNLGCAYYWMNKYDKSAHCCRKVASIDPSDKYTYINLGNSYYWMREYNKAIDTLLEAISLHPRCEKTLYYLARTYFKMGNMAAAKQAGEKSLHIAPTYQASRNLLKKIKQAMLANMSMIPAGEFPIGSNATEAKDPENSAHTVYVDEFYIDIYPVTNAQYKEFVDANPEWQREKIPQTLHYGDYLKHWNRNNYPYGKGNHPVVYVSWYAAMAYAEWVDKRLPTEAEWEKAAHWNHEFSNMRNKVWEWCLDVPGFRVIDTTKSSIVNFMDLAGMRILRGDFSQPRRRRPQFTSAQTGFRCVRTVTT